MAKKLFITGTGTDIGKTYIAGLIVKKLLEGGYNVGYYKAAMSGNIRRYDGTLLPGDADFVKRISCSKQDVEEMCPYVYETAVSPHLASRIEKNPIKMEIIEKTFNDVCSKYDYVVVEGSGGILCPISYDGERIQLEDIVKKFDLPGLLVADAGLGTINGVVLTNEYMKNNGMHLNGIIFNNYHLGDVMEEDNLFMCEQMTGLKVVECVSRGVANMKITADELVKLFE